MALNNSSSTRKYKVYTSKLRYKLVYTLMKNITPRLYGHVIECGGGAFPFTRPMIARLRQVFGSAPLTGVEIGVAEGKNAENILKILNVTHLFLIDPYEAYLENGRLETSARAHSINEMIMKARLKPFWNRVTFLKFRSQDAVNKIPQVDFVYIDGCHVYDSVRKDIQLYSSKVRLGGFIGGHDFNWPGVAKAVQEFANDNHALFINFPPDWYIQLMPARTTFQEISPPIIV